MTDHDDEQRLRDWFRDEDDRTRVAPSTLRHNVITIAGQGSRGTFGFRRWMPLAAAALAMLVAGFAAVGSGLVRLPTPLPAPLSLDTCQPTLADDLVISVWRERSGLTFVYRDGLVLASGWATSPGGAPVDKVLRQRRLKPESVADLLRSATEPGLKGCRDVPIDGADDLHVTVRDGGSVDDLHTGSGRYSVARADPATTAAAAALYRRLMDRDLGAGADQWADGAWTEYQPDRYAVTVTVPTGVVPPTSGPWTTALPDGSTPLTFGAIMPGADSSGTYITRCGFVDPGEARAIRDAIQGSPGISTNATPISAPNAGFLVPFFDLDTYSGLEARAALPHERSCTDLYPTPEPPTRGDPALESVDVCALLAGGAMPDQNGQPPASSIGNGLAWRDQDGTSACDFANADTSVFYRIGLRTQPTTAADAEELVRGAFGDGGYRQTEIAGTTTYLDACAYAALGCEPAIIISADPYFLLIGGNPQPTAGETEKVLRALAATAIERLGR